MKTLKIAGLLAITSISLSALSSCGFFKDEVAFQIYDDSKYSIGNFTYTEAITKIDVNWVGGNVDVVVGDKTEYSVSETGTDLNEAQKIRYFMDETVLKIEYCSSGYFGKIDAKKKNLTLEIPQGIEYNIHTVSGELKVLNDIVTEHKVKLYSVSGALFTKGIKGSVIDLQSVSGGITTELLEAAEVEIDETSGNVDVKVKATKVDIDNISGRVTLEIVSAEDVNIDCVSGAINITINKTDGASIKYTTVSGKFNSKLSQVQKDGKHIFGEGKTDIDVDTISGGLTIL